VKRREHDLALSRAGERPTAGLRNAHGKDVPILVITADGRAAEKARRVGAFDYLHKPFEFDDLIAAVTRGLEGD